MSRIRREETTSYNIASMAAASGIIHFGRQINRNGPRAPNTDRTEDKMKWTNGYANWTEKQFKKRLRVSRDTFEKIHDGIGPLIEKTPTNMVPEPIETHRQLAITLYRCAHASTFSTLEDLFGVSESLAESAFNTVMRAMIGVFFS